MKDSGIKGFTNPQVIGLSNNYQNGSRIPANPTFSWGTSCPLDGGKKDGKPTSTVDPKTYFYKGLGEADCIEYLYELGIVS